MKRVLVTGGAGYIGSVCAVELRRYGFEVVTLDDLSTGHREAVSGELVVGDVRDRVLLRSLFSRGFDAVLHFAGAALVGESVVSPLRYWDINTAGTIALVEAMREADVRSLVFSSTCAVYGAPQRLPLDEAHPRAPVSPYGESKDVAERVLSAARERHGLRIAALRYFNAAGAMPDGSLGESHATETHLIPLALDAALGKRPPLSVFGDDWETPDGTCIRDYVHVLDLADAHVRALRRLLDGFPGRSWNLGTGRGASVREVLAAVEKETGRSVPFTIAPRRDGDPAALYATADLARADLGWEPTRTLSDIVRDAARWAASPAF